MSRQLSKLHAAAGAEQERWLLRRASDCLALLIAAGAMPAGTTSNASLAAAAAALEPADWEAVRQAASKPPQWTPSNHRQLFPASYHRAAQEVLKVALRGFTVPTAACYQHSGSEEGRTPTGGGSSMATDGGGQRASPTRQQPSQQQRQHRTFYLDGHIVQCIVKHLAPCSQL